MGEVNRMDIEEIIKERTRERKCGNRRDKKAQVTQKQVYIKVYNLFCGHYAAISTIKTTHLAVNHSVTKQIITENLI